MASSEASVPSEKVHLTKTPAGVHHEAPAGAQPRPHGVLLCAPTSPGARRVAPCSAAPAGCCRTLSIFYLSKVLQDQACLVHHHPPGFCSRQPAVGFVPLSREQAAFRFPPFPTPCLRSQEAPCVRAEHRLLGSFLVNRQQGSPPTPKIMTNLLWFKVYWKPCFLPCSFFILSH